eukprot:849320-Ditylum_brightwellii.AAC.1
MCMSVGGAGMGGRDTAGYVQKSIFRKPQTLFECHGNPGVPKQGLHAPEEWIARVIKLNNYLTEFPTPAGIEAKKLEDEKILEVLENGIPTS